MCLRAKRTLTAIFFLLLLPGLNYSGSAIPIPALMSPWREAAPGYQYSFPRDHAAHPDYRVEWWYYTGNLQSKSGRRFGYQLTFFRVGISRDLTNASKWALRDLYMAHFAISDIDRQSFQSFELINRAGIGWAGADTLEPYKSSEERHPPNVPIRVWNEDWVARIDENTHSLQASEEGYSINLKLVPAKPEVIHGENGISQRGPSPANASHYYSVSRAESTGQITIGEEIFDVSGLSWIDHEFGTSFLDEQKKGWDWFSIQLEDGRDLMLFQVRRVDDSIDSHSAGTLIDASGRNTHLGYSDFSLTPGGAWQSPGGANYPVTWNVDLPQYSLSLNVAAALPDQELRTNDSTGITYWEGSIIVEDTKDRNIRGRGYLEMTGYAGTSMGRMLR
jgi:predicted secreted hydrolase